MKRLAAAALFVVGCRPTPPAEQYGFVTRLGRDTVSVESVTRRDNTVTSDEVDRFPRVRQRHTEIELSDSGAIRRLVMDIHTPSEPANLRDRHVVVEVTKDSVHITKHDSAGTVRRDFATAGGTAMGHLPQMYSLYELYFDAALQRAHALHLAAGDTVPMRQFYIDREFDRFPLGHGTVTLRPGNKAEIDHDWLAGTGEATLDSAGHMLSYSGERTTYKVSVERVNDSPDVKAIADQFSAREAKSGGARELSVRDTARGTIGGATLTVNYSRPLARGRVLLGGIIPYDRVWRTGANAATHFTTSAPITLAGLRLPAGTYTLWTLPHASGVDLIVNKQTGQWGTQYDADQDLGRAPMVSGAPTTPVEQFTISVVPVDAQHGTLVMEWGTFRWTAEIVTAKQPPQR
jgi:hypothetical protein